MTPPRRVFAYVRVSGAEQARSGTSLDGQLDQARAAARARGWPEPVLHVEVESAGAERIEQRAELRRLLATVDRGDAVMVCNVDRWSRDIVFAVQSVRALIARGVGWVSVGESIDASTPQGDSTLGIMAWVADQERQRIRARTVGRRRELRAQGLFVEGIVAFGYKRAGRRLEVVEDEAVHVREAFRLAATGWSLRQIAQELTQLTGKRWTHDRVSYLLQNRIYLGEIKAPDGAIMQGTHEAIVDRALFERARQGLAARRLGGAPAGRPAARTADWLLSGCASCPRCGSRMGAVYGRSADYYACAGRLAGRGCDAPYVRVSVADHAVAAAVLKRLVALRAELAREPRPAAKPGKKIDFGARRARLTDQLDRAARLAVEGAITPAELRSQRERIDRELAEVAVQEDAARSVARAAAPEARRETLGHVKTLVRAWAKMPVPAKRIVLQALAAKVFISPLKAPVIEWHLAEELDKDIGNSAKGTVGHDL